MTRSFVVCLIAFAAAGDAVAQLPSKQPPISSLPPSVISGASVLSGVDLPPGQVMAPRILGPNGEPTLTEQLTQFDPATLEVRRERDHVRLWAGRVMLKDFGGSYDDANATAQLFRDLKVNAKGTVGPAGVFEYWLSDGKAPFGPTHTRQVVPFGASRLKAERVAGNWSLTDGRIILANFGQSEADAKQALAVSRHYEFNQLGVVGQPIPTLHYYLRDPAAAPAVGLVNPAAGGSATPDAVPVQRGLSLPEVGVVGARTPLNWRQLDIRRDRNSWKLMSGKDVFADFGSSEREGRDVMVALQQFRCTEYCWVGSSGFGFFLSAGRAPQGPTLGTGAKTFRPELLSVRPLNGSWIVGEGFQPVFEFGQDEVTARSALAAIKHYQFDAVVPLGSGTRLGGLRLLVRAR